jgi:hypothetical protein
MARLLECLLKYRRDRANARVESHDEKPTSRFEPPNLLSDFTSAGRSRSRKIHRCICHPRRSVIHLGRPPTDPQAWGYTGGIVKPRIATYATCFCLRHQRVHALTMAQTLID